MAGHGIVGPEVQGWALDGRFCILGEAQEWLSLIRWWFGSGDSGARAGLGSAGPVVGAGLHSRSPGFWASSVVEILEHGLGSGVGVLDYGLGLGVLALEYGLSSRVTVLDSGLVW